MSLGAGVLKVSAGPNAISKEEVSMATLEARTRAATNQHHQTEWNLVEILKRILTWENTNESTKLGGKRGSKNQQWFIRRQKLMCYSQQEKLQCNTTLAKEHTRSPAIPWGPPHRSRTGVGEEHWPTHASLTLPKWYLATLKLGEKLVHTRLQ